MSRLRTIAVYVCILLALLSITSLLPDARIVNAQGSDVTVTIDEVDTSTFPNVRVRVSVRDRNGVPIPDLTTEHFEMIENGAETFEPTGVETESNPNAQVSLAFVIDMYRTLEGEPIEAAQQATKDLLTDLLNEPDDPDHAAFVGVREGVSTDPAEIDETYEVPFTNDRNKLLNVINFLHERIQRSGPGTPLYDAVIKAVRLAAATEPVGHRAVIVMTDGEDRGSVNTDSDTIQSASNARTPVFTVGLSNSGLDEQYLQRLADQTGGIYQAAETPDDFSPLFSNVLTMLRTQYVLTYDSGLPQDGQSHSLLVHVRTPTQMEGFQEYRLETPGGSSGGTEQQSTPTPAPSGASPTPEPAGGTTIDDVRQWVEDNMLVAILGVAAVGLLLLAIAIVIIIIIRRRGQAEEDLAPPYPEAPADFGADFGAEAGYGDTEQPFEDLGAPAPPPTVTEGEHPFGTEPSAPYDYGDFAAPPPPSFPEPDFQPSSADRTRILKREPKMSVVGLLIDREQPSQRFDVAKPSVMVGRAQSSDVVVDHNTVSRQHATIKLEEGQFRLYDLGSTNGTFVGEERIREPVVLEDGSTIRFGERTFIFKIISLDV